MPYRGSRHDAIERTFKGSKHEYWVISLWWYIHSTSLKIERLPLSSMTTPAYTCSWSPRRHVTHITHVIEYRMRTEDSSRGIIWDLLHYYSEFVILGKVLQHWQMQEILCSKLSSQTSSMFSSASALKEEFYLRTYPFTNVLIAVRGWTRWLSMKPLNTHVKPSFGNLTPKSTPADKHKIA